MEKKFDFNKYIRTIGFLRKLIIDCNISDEVEIVVEKMDINAINKKKIIKLSNEIDGNVDLVLPDTITYDNELKKVIIWINQ